jgi:DNA-binding GntR family transcriptional regulator
MTDGGMRTTKSSDPTTRAPGVDVHASPLTEQVYLTLHGWIANGQLPPGYRLRVRDIAERVGTSPMPVRLAVRRLVEVGLAEHEPYRGATVRGLDVDELRHAYDVRIALESEAARRGAECATPQVVAVMEEHWHKLDDAARRGDVVEALTHDEAMLECLYSTTGNTILCDIIRGLWHRCRPYKVLWARTAIAPGEPHIWQYKPALVEAARAQDGAAAEEVIRASYGAARATLVLLVKSGAPSIDM